MLLALKKEYITTKTVSVVVACFLIACLLFSSTAQRTSAYYNDHETSSGNTFSAALFDLVLSKSSIEERIGPGLTDEIDFDTLLLQGEHSLTPQYATHVEFKDGDPHFCHVINLVASGGGFGEVYDGPLLDFTAPTTTALGTWEFDLELQKYVGDFPQGATCDADIVFNGWRSDVSDPSESGYTDEERVTVHLTADMVVLNEFLPNPEGVAYGFDFGSDSSDMPQGEWVELYNNSDYPADLSNWYIWDDSGSLGNQIQITASNTQPASTVIGAHDWLVVYMNKALLNNTGDTVQLFNASDTPIDSYTYTTHDWCSHEPTPTDPNAVGVGGGACSDVPPNKSYARIPDGIGSWLDPIPTPGSYNLLGGIPVNTETTTTEAVVDSGAGSDEVVMNVGTTTNQGGTEGSVSTTTISTSETDQPETILDASSTQDVATDTPEVTSDDSESGTGTSTEQTVTDATDTNAMENENPRSSTEPEVMEDSVASDTDVDTSTDDVTVSEPEATIGEEEPMKEPDPVEEVTVTEDSEVSGGDGAGATT